MYATDMTAVATKSSEIWRPDEGVPPWFKPEKFLDQNFEAESYVADLRRYVSTSPPCHVGEKPLLV